jgi:hypothetical protein
MVVRAPATEVRYAWSSAYSALHEKTAAGYL